MVVSVVVWCGLANVCILCNYVCMYVRMYEGYLIFIIRFQKMSRLNKKNQDCGKKARNFSEMQVTYISQTGATEVHSFITKQTTS
jgi:hypothetical protein